MVKTTKFDWFVITVFVWVIAAWLTHVINTIQNHEWILLLIGSFIFPIGIIHGTGIWFNLF